MRALLLVALILAGPVARAATAEALCGLIERAAAAHALPAPFLARIIWTESRFDVKALSPKGAQGVAQFMPGTAKLRGLADPWDPAQAIPAAAAYLADLRAQFGDLGRAAAAYNSGEARVAAWLAGNGGLPAETRSYVFQVTGREAGAFRAAPRRVEAQPIEAGKSFREGCARLPVIATRAAPRRPWAAQLAGATTRRAAQNAWRRLKRRHPTLRAHAPVITRNRFRRGSRPLWQVRVGMTTRAGAGRLCAALRAQGGACVVTRNR